MGRVDWANPPYAWSERLLMSLHKMTPDEAVYAWAVWWGPTDATRADLKELNLLDERAALVAMQDDVDDGEVGSWPTYIHEAYAVLKEKHDR